MVMIPPKSGAFLITGRLLAVSLLEVNRVHDTSDTRLLFQSPCCTSWPARAQGHHGRLTQRDCSRSPGVAEEVEGLSSPPYQKVIGLRQGPDSSDRPGDLTATSLSPQRLLRRSERTLSYRSHIEAYVRCASVARLEAAESAPVVLDFTIPLWNNER